MNEDEVKLEEIKKVREEEIKRILAKFFREVAVNIITDEGITNAIDASLHIDRQKLIGEVMIAFGQEMVKDENTLSR